MEGAAQGCHLHVRTKLSILQHTTQCAVGAIGSGELVGIAVWTHRWGWCGLEHPGCTSLETFCLRCVDWLWTFALENGQLLAGWATTCYYIHRNVHTGETSFVKAQAVLQHGHEQ